MNLHIFKQRIYFFAKFLWLSSFSFFLGQPRIGSDAQAAAPHLALKGRDPKAKNRNRPVC